MDTYKYVCEFKLDNIKYIMFMDKNNKRYFLKNMNNCYSYVTDEELFNILENLHHSDDVYDYLQNKKKKHKIIPKIVIGGTSLLLTPPLLLTSLMLYNRNRFNEAKGRVTSQIENQNIITEEQLSEDYLNRYLSVAESYNSKGSEVDTYLASDMFHYAYIYDMDYLSIIYDDRDITLDDLNEVISTNQNIPDKFKEIMYDYCNQLCSKYNDIELRPFYENLKTLEIVECNSNELLLHTLNSSSNGCYVKSENKIYIPKNYVYQKGTWEYQVIFHELSHCLRTHITKIGNTDVKVQCEGLNFSNTTTAESLNSLFAVSLFDYEENDIAYQLQSNYHKVMIECMNNYTLSDYINHSVSYYAQKLDEHNEEQGQAPVILELIELQFDDFHSERISIIQEQFYPIYEYISKMYYNKYLHEGMSYEEMKSIADELISRITFDVPDDYQIDIDYFYSYFENYISEHNYISVKVKK